MVGFSKQYRVYVGTYTNGGSLGIYTYNLDVKTGKLEQISVASKVDNPSYLAISRDNKLLYAALENKVFNDEVGGAVAAFVIEPVTGKLKLLNMKATKGKSPCHLCTDSENKYVFAANYNEGTVSMFPVNETGDLSEVSLIVKHEGSGPNKIRQTMSHMHYVTLTPDEKHLCAVDLGTDTINVYDLDKDQGTLTLNEKFTLKIKAGSGPRHMEFHPNGKIAYIITELASEIVVAKFSQENYTFEVMQHISTLPKDHIGESTCGAIHIAPNGKYLYASNRGHDSIAIFNIEQCSGKLDIVAHSSTYGECPRDFQIEPTGNYLYALNQSSDTIVPFKIDPSTGKLEIQEGVIKVPSPVCIKFACL